MTEELPIDEQASSIHDGEPPTGADGADGTDQAATRSPELDQRLATWAAVTEQVQRDVVAPPESVRAEHLRNALLAFDEDRAIVDLDAEDATGPPAAATKPAAPAPPPMAPVTAIGDAPSRRRATAWLAGAAAAVVLVAGTLGLIALSGGSDGGDDAEEAAGEIVDGSAAADDAGAFESRSADSTAADGLGAETEIGATASVGAGAPPSEDAPSTEQGPDSPDSTTAPTATATPGIISVLEADNPSFAEIPPDESCVASLRNRFADGAQATVSRVVELPSGQIGYLFELDGTTVAGFLVDSACSRPTGEVIGP